MVLSDTIAYVTILAVTIVFSSFALALGSNEKLRIVNKVIAGLTWFVLALTQFYFFGGSHPLCVPMMFLFMGIGSVFCYSIVQDFKTEKNDRIWKFDED
jgi:uncharacterized membrane protein